MIMKERQKTYVVIGELAHVVLVHTESLSFGTGAHAAVRNEVHDPQDNSLLQHLKLGQNQSIQESELTVMTKE